MPTCTSRQSLVSSQYTRSARPFVDVGQFSFRPPADEMPPLQQPHHHHHAHHHVPYAPLTTNEERRNRGMQVEELEKPTEEFIGLPTEVGELMTSVTGAAPLVESLRYPCSPPTTAGGRLSVQPPLSRSGGEPHWKRRLAQRTPMTSLRSSLTTPSIASLNKSLRQHAQQQHQLQLWNATLHGGDTTHSSSTRLQCTSAGGQSSGGGGAVAELTMFPPILFASEQGRRRGGGVPPVAAWVPGRSLALMAADEPVRTAIAATEEHATNSFNRNNNGTEASVGIVSNPPPPPPTLTPPSSSLPISAPVVSSTANGPVTTIAPLDHRRSSGGSTRTPGTARIATTTFLAVVPLDSSHHQQQQLLPAAHLGSMGSSFSEGEESLLPADYRRGTMEPTALLALHMPDELVSPPTVPLGNNAAGDSGRVGTQRPREQSEGGGGTSTTSSNSVVLDSKVLGGSNSKIPCSPRPLMPPSSHHPRNSSSIHDDGGGMGGSRLLPPAPLPNPENSALLFQRYAGAISPRPGDGSASASPLSIPPNPFAVLQNDPRPLPRQPTHVIAERLQACATSLQNRLLEMEAQDLMHRDDLTRIGSRALASFGFVKEMRSFMADESDRLPQRGTYAHLHPLDQMGEDAAATLETIEANREVTWTTVLKTEVGHASPSLKQQQQQQQQKQQPPPSSVQPRAPLAPRGGGATSARPSTLPQSSNLNGTAQSARILSAPQQPPAMPITRTDSTKKPSLPPPPPPQQKHQQQQQQASHGTTSFQMSNTAKQYNSNSSRLHEEGRRKVPLGSSSPSHTQPQQLQQSHLILTEAELLARSEERMLGAVARQNQQQREQLQREAERSGFRMGGGGGGHGTATNATGDEATVAGSNAPRRSVSGGGGAASTARSPSSKRRPSEAGGMTDNKRRKAIQDVAFVMQQRQQNLTTDAPTHQNNATVDAQDALLSGVDGQGVVISAEAAVNFKLFSKDASLFSVTGDDTDPSQFPNFPFHREELQKPRWVHNPAALLRQQMRNQQQQQQSQSKTGGPTSSSSSVAAATKSIEEKLERTHLIRRLMNQTFRKRQQQQSSSSPKQGESGTAPSQSNDGEVDMDQVDAERDLLMWKRAAGKLPEVWTAEQMANRRDHDLQYQWAVVATEKGFPGMPRM